MSNTIISSGMIIEVPCVIRKRCSLAAFFCRIHIKCSFFLINSWKSLKRFANIGYGMESCQSCGMMVDFAVKIKRLSFPGTTDSKNLVLN